MGWWDVACNCDEVYLMEWFYILSSMLAPLVPLFFLTGCACCGAACGDGCSTTPTEATVTITGFTNNSCLACADYNTTYIIPRDLTFAAQFCGFRSFFSFGCDVGATPTDVVLVRIGLTGGDTVVLVSLQINAVTSITNWDANLGSGPIGCGGYGTFNVPFTSTGGSLCSHDGSSATVTL